MDNIVEAKRRVFSQRFRTRCEELGYSQVDVASRTEISKDRINRYANGKSLPRDKNKERIIVALQTDESFLFPDPLPQADELDGSKGDTVSMRMSPNPGKMIISINQVELPTEVAVETIRMVTGAMSPDELEALREAGAD